MHAENEMKIFDQVKPFEDKVNFVDQNNVVVGYDMSQDCCEYADWLIADAPTDQFHNGCSHQTNVDETDYIQYCFDVDYFEEDGYDETSIAIFRLVAPELPDKFLHLHNTHNGYYSHGFTMKVNEQMIRSGGL